MIVGLVSDTHGRFNAALPRLLRGCDLILHAGDVGGHDVLHQLSMLAPVKAVRGNTDVGERAEGLEDVLRLQLDDLTVVLLHEVSDPVRFRSTQTRGVDLVVYGHSHSPAVQQCGGTLFVNPGSAGPRRFDLPRCAGLMKVEGRHVEVDVFDLDRPDLPRLRAGLAFDL